MRKVKAHQALEEIEDPKQRFLAQGNSWADAHAKNALRIHPQWSEAEGLQAELLLADAAVTARLNGEVHSRWPQAPAAQRLDRRRRAQAAKDRSMKIRQRWAARTAAAREEQRESCRRRDATHVWATSTWGVTRCQRCLRRRGRRTPACLGNNDEHPLLAAARAAHDRNHDLWAAAASNPGEEEKPRS